jgi:hypothetical protein
MISVEGNNADQFSVLWATMLKKISPLSATTQNNYYNMD